MEDDDRVPLPVGEGIDCVGRSHDLADTGEEETTGRILPMLTLDWSLPMVRTDTHWQHLIEPVVAGVLAPYGGNPGTIPNGRKAKFLLVGSLDSLRTDLSKQVFAGKAFHPFLEFFPSDKTLRNSQCRRSCGLFAQCMILPNGYSESS
jgi:hypothetical protein